MRNLRGKIMTGIASVGLAAVLFVTGCSTTVESTPAAEKALESGGTLPPAVTGFFGPDASKLAPGPQGGAALAYINPNAQWSSYTKIQLMPVEFWAAADSKVSTADQQTLTEYFYNQLQTDIAKSFTLVNQPGPGVLTHPDSVDGCDHGSSWTPHRIGNSSASSRAEPCAIDGDRQLRVCGFGGGRNESDRFCNR